MHVSRPYRVGIIAALALLCMAPNPAAARTSEKSPKTPEIAGDIAAVALPAAGLIVSLAVGDRQGVKQLGSGVRRRSGRRLRVEIRDRQIPAGRTRRAGLPVHSLGGRLRRSIVHPTTLRLEIRSSGLRAGRLCRLEPHRSRRAKTRHLGRARRSGFGSGLRLPVYEALPQTENIVRRRSDRFGRRMRRSPRRPRVLNHPSANGKSNTFAGGTVPAFFYRALSETDKPFRRASESISPKKRAATGGRASTGCRFRLSSDLRTRPTGRLACRTKANAAMSVIQKIVHPRGLIAKPIRQ